MEHFKKLQWVDFDESQLDEFVKQGFSFVYFMQDGSHIKIGKSNNPFRRLKGVQTGNPRRVDLLRILPTAHPKKEEAFWKKAFEENRVRGEWFELSESMWEFLVTGYLPHSIWKNYFTK